MNNFWDERYATEEYVYGTEPNEYFKQKLKKLTPGKMLMPGEGEGRNAVYAASLGWEVTAFDSSAEGKRKAERLALKNKVIFNYLINDYDSIRLEREEFDGIGLIYTHVTELNRHEYHKKLVSFLKPGGILIMEGFSKKQIHNNTGGPGDVGMLFSKDELQYDFCDFSKLSITEEEIVNDEGPYHRGKASVIRVYGVK